MTDLTKAIAELQRISVSKTEHLLAPHDEPFATILNAALSGDLIPRADADLAVALMVEKAATHVRTAEVPREETGEGAMQRALLNYAADVVSLCAPASALAELQALREERDVAIDSATQQDALRKATLATMRSISAENEDLRTELATLRAQVERLTGALTAIDDLGAKSGAEFRKCHPKLDAALDKVDQQFWSDVLADFARAALTEGAAP